MFKLLISEFLWLGSLLGWGMFFSRWGLGARGEISRRLGIGKNLLLGFCALANLSLFIHFFSPLNQTVSVLCLVGGWILLWGGRRSWIQQLDTGTFIFLICTCLGVSAIAVVSYFNVDTGYYHLPSIAVINRFPLLPGIANLFGPFGHNSTWFLIEGLYRLPFLNLASIFSVNSLLAIIFLLILREEFLSASLWSVGMITASLFMMNHVGLGLGGVTPDFPLACLSVLSWLCFLEVVFKSEKQEPLAFPFFCTIVCFAITVKVSAINLVIPFLVACGLRRNEIKTREFFNAMVANGTFLFFWLGRGFLTSGCGLYPQRITCIYQLKWALPAEKVGYWLADIKKHLCGVALEGAIYRDPKCLLEWWNRLWLDPIWKSVVVIILISLSVKLTQRALRRKAQQIHFPMMSILIVSVVLFCILSLWLATAPNLRFLMWWVFAAVGFGFSIAFQGWLHLQPRKLKWFYLMVLVAGGLTFRSAWLTRPFKVQWNDWPAVPQGDSAELITEAGVTISKPLNDFRCWDMAPPCTPEEIQFKVHRGLLNRVWFSSKSH